MLFDLDKIAMKSDPFDPARSMAGVELVLVNGWIVYEDMAHTGARRGRVLRRVEH